MKNMIGLIVLSLIGLNASAESIPRQVFGYECKRLNKLELGIKCEYTSGLHVTFHYLPGYDESDERTAYEFGKLWLRYASLGGQAFRIRSHIFDPGEYKHCDITDPRGKYLCRMCKDSSDNC